MTDLTPDRLTKLKEKRNKLNKQIQKMEALESQRERKRDTRRKIVVGAYYMDKALKENTWKELVAIMDKFLTRNSDRVLFDLLEISKEQKEGKE